MTAPIFETERLLVRPLRADDFPAFFEMQGNPNVLRHTGSPAMTEAEAGASLKNCIDCYAQPGNNFWVWAVVRKMDGAFVGTAAVVGEEHELGYRFLEKHWGNGYGREVANGLVEHALHGMGLPGIWAEADKDNVASVKILEGSKLQFEKEYFHEKDQCLVRRYRLKK